MFLSSSLTVSIIDLFLCNNLSDTPIIADEVQLEPEKPSHEAPAFSSYPFEKLVHMDSLIATHSQRDVVLVFLYYFDKPVVQDCIWKKITVPLAYAVQI